MKTREKRVFFNLFSQVIIDEKKKKSEKGIHLICCQTKMLSAVIGRPSLLPST